MERGLSIGKVAAKAGVNVQTLRFYERRGLLTEPPPDGSWLPGIPVRIHSTRPFVYP
jgi:hypothetical protein